MRHEPDAANLLAAARDVLRDSIIPGLSGAARYDALMVANAVAIAARQIAAGDRPLEEARERLAALYGAPDATLAELEDRFARDLRAGVFDAPSEARAAAFDHLWKASCSTAAESNPKALRLPRVSHEGGPELT